MHVHLVHDVEVYLNNLGVFLFEAYLIGAHIIVGDVKGMFVIDAEAGLVEDFPGVEFVEDHVDGGDVVVEMEIEYLATVVALNFILEAGLGLLEGNLD